MKPNTDQLAKPGSFAFIPEVPLVLLHAPPLRRTHPDPFFYHTKTKCIYNMKSKLYTSHLLSTWNSRVFEFGAVLFLSTIFPGTLLPASVYALSRAASVIVFSGHVGRFIDHGHRMHVVRISIGKSL